MKWFLAAVILGILCLVLACCRVAGEADDQMAAERSGFQIVSPGYVPPEPTPEPWVRYPVPLDDELQKYIIQQCRDRGIEPSIVFAQISVESGCKADAVGDEGNSVGLMQIYRSVHEARMERLGVVNLFDPYQNVAVGIDLMGELAASGKSMDWVLTAYNWGMGKADEFEAAGYVCNYAREVQERAELLVEGAMLVTE